MTPKAALLDAGDTFLLCHLDKSCYLLCNEHNNVPIPVSAYTYTVINRSLSCDCQLQGGNEFLHESLASCPTAGKVDRKVYFTINIAFVNQP